MTQRTDHRCQGVHCVGKGQPAPGSLQRNPDKPQLRNRRGEEDYPAFPLRRANPGSGPFVLDVVRPSPGDQHIDIEKVLHGNSVSISRTRSVVSGGSSGRGAKISAPVWAQRVFFTIRWDGSPIDRRLRNSETVKRSRLARRRICRASSSDTLKLIVFIRITVLPYGPMSNPEVQGTHRFGIRTWSSWRGCPCTSATVSSFCCA